MTTFAVIVRFIVDADTLEEARERVKILIEHGRASHDADVDWEWSKASR